MHCICKSVCLLFFLLVTSCGGGGGDDVCNDSVACIAPDPDILVDTTPFLGVYKTDFYLASNTCEKSAAVDKFSETYTVMEGVGYHGFPLFSVASDTGLTFVSTATKDVSDGESYFQTFQEGTRTLSNFIPGLTCEESINLFFRNVGAGSGITVSRTSQISCVGINNAATYSCEVYYEGDAERS